MSGLGLGADADAVAILRVMRNESGVEAVLGVNLIAFLMDGPGRNLDSINGPKEVSWPTMYDASEGERQR